MPQPDELISLVNAARRQPSDLGRVRAGAAATLGHSSAKLTDEVYAERDLQRVAEVMKRMG